MLKTLMVVANPFSALDHEGVPAGAFAFDPEQAAGARRWVGAVIDTERTKVVPVKSTEQLKGRHVRFEPIPRQRTFFKFDLRPQPVLDTKHYRDGLLHGDIFPADEGVARAVGLQSYKPPEEAMAVARDAAVAKWEQAYGSLPDFALWPEDLRPQASERGTTTTAIVAAGSDQ